jgi:hypothetical protein
VWTVGELVLLLTFISFCFSSLASRLKGFKD